MPSVEHTLIVPAPFATVWPFVRDMDNWAPLLTGYQRHEKVSDEKSIWFLKGELGGLTRVAKFAALITEWDEAGRVGFKLEGADEPVTGSGRFVAEAIAPAEADVAPTADTGARISVLRRLARALARMLLHRVSSPPHERASPPPEPPPGGEGQTKILFELTLTAGGMAGPVLNMLLAPMLRPVAEDLANGIAAEIMRGGTTATPGPGQAPGTSPSQKQGV